MADTGGTLVVLRSGSGSTVKRITRSVQHVVGKLKQQPAAHSMANDCGTEQ